jgi:integrase
MRRRLVYACALHTGLRQGELAVLRVLDVVLEGGYLNVHKARDRRTGGTKSTKGKRASRGSAPAVAYGSTKGSQSPVPSIRLRRARLSVGASQAGGVTAATPRSARSARIRSSTLAYGARAGSVSLAGSR